MFTNLLVDIRDCFIRLKVLAKWLDEFNKNIDFY